MSEATEQLQKALDEVENYQQTVKALLAFAAFVVHDGNDQRPGAEFGFGRRMTTSADNAVRPESEVTPDLVAQKSNGYGITAEVKKSLPRDQALWAKYLEQLLKYDDELVGWWTDDKKMPCADTVMLIHQSRGRPFCRFVQHTQTEAPETVGENTNVVEFNSSEETRSYYFFRLEHGTIRDEELAGRLADGVQIPLEKVVDSFPNVKYYDAPPPVAYVLKDLWMEIFPAMLEGVEYDENYKALKFAASVREVTHELQRAYGSDTLTQDQRSAQFPTHRWIKEAFDKLVELRMALPPGNGSDVYQILFRTLRGDVLNRFIEMDLRLKGTHESSAAAEPDQLYMFSDDEAEE